MIGVDLIGQIRRAFFEQRRPIKEIVRTLSVSRATVRKVVRGQATEFKYARGVQPTPKLGEWIAVLTEILEAEATLPKRERRSTQRLFEELRGRGYDGAHDSVHRFVKAWRDERARVPAQAFVPLSFAPGEAYQFDWSHETITLQGLPLMIKAAHISCRTAACRSCAPTSARPRSWCSTLMTRRSSSMAASAGAASTTT
jgi:transposase